MAVADPQFGGMTISKSTSGRPPLTIVIPPEALRVLKGGERIVSPGIWYGHIAGVQYQSTITRAAVLVGPTWTLSEPLPLAPAVAAKKARRALAKLTRGHRLWQVSQISIQRLEGATPQRWFFVVCLDRGSDGQGVLQVPVTFGGMIGKVEKVKSK